VTGRVVLEARDVSVVRDGRAVVDTVSFTGLAGELVGIGGPSGSGKTSLLTTLSGLAAPDGGSVLLHGSPRVGMVLQGYGLVPVLTAAENVEIVLQAEGRPAEEVSAAAAFALGRVLVGELGDRLVDRLSGGQQQRVAVARALVAEPEVLLADEPTSELDEVSRDHVVRELVAHARAGALVVLASHDRDVLAACDRTLWLVDGRLAAEPDRVG
jgi:ABC-type lipoprotein export system ATPase subunit